MNDKCPECENGNQELLDVKIEEYSKGTDFEEEIGQFKCGYCGLLYEKINETFESWILGTI